RAVRQHCSSPRQPQRSRAMSETTLDPIDRQEVSSSKRPEQQSRIQSDVREVPISEQRQLLNDERRRVSETTQWYLPDVVLTLCGQISPSEKDPKVQADSEKRKRELAMSTQNQATPAYDGSNQGRSAGSGSNNQQRTFGDGGTQSTGSSEGQSHNTSNGDIVRQRIICPATTADTSLRSSNLLGLFLSNMPRLDTDHDGFVSRSEIDAAVTDPTYTGRDAQLVAVLHEHREELEELSNDEFGDENDGVTYADMREFNAQLAQSTTAGQIYAVGTFNFDRIDTDRDGFLSELELDSAAHSTSAPIEYRRVVQEMLSRTEQMQAASDDEFGFENDGITRADLQAYNNDVASHSPTDLFNAVDNTLYNSGDSIRRSCHSLYATANPLDSIRPEAIHQGSIGDCYFLSAMASMANDPVGRQQLHDMIHDNGNGTYTVTFPGAPDEPVTVSAPADAETALFAQGNKLGTWPAILERAYG